MGEGVFERRINKTEKDNMSKQYQMGLFDEGTMTVQFGGEHSKPEKIFTARAIKIPDFEYRVYEREDAGNGWYGSKQWNTYIEKFAYLILRDGQPIGFMRQPYVQKIKTPLLELDDKYVTHEMKQFLKNNTP